MKKFETFYTPLFLALPFLIVIVAMFAYFIKTYPVLLEKEKNAQLVSEPQKILETDPALDLSKIKTYEKITQDITKVGQKPADKEIVYFENEKKKFLLSTMSLALSQLQNLMEINGFFYNLGTEALIV